MSWALISDSSCNLRDWQPTAPHTTFAYAPLKIRVGEREFVDDLTLDVRELNCAVQAESSASSSACPSVGEWTELFRLADKTICMPISEASREATCRRTARDWFLPRSEPKDSSGQFSRTGGKWT
mgnify:CR=1 FL=1